MASSLEFGTLSEADKRLTFLRKLLASTVNGDERGEIVAEIKEIEKLLREARTERAN